jgi:ubiquitin-conjugating enzyme E2 T
MIAAKRIQQESRLFHATPGVSVKIISETHLEARIIGLKPSCYEDGHFVLDIQIPVRYPFEPPSVIFRTRILHPNIDSNGRICLSALKLPPAGTWNPALTITGLLQCIQMLLMEPNPQDPLDIDAASLYSANIGEFQKQAKLLVWEHARPN